MSWGWLAGSDRGCAAAGDVLDAWVGVCRLGLRHILGVFPEEEEFHSFRSLVLILCVADLLPYHPWAVFLPLCGAPSDGVRRCKARALAFRRRHDDSFCGRFARWRHQTPLPGVRSRLPAKRASLKRLEQQQQPAP
jgi:hypothetical protein